jgi:hypothetical protein
MSSRTAPASPVSPVLALDADGDEFVMNFGFPAVSTARPAVVAPEVDSTAAKLASEQIGNRFRRSELVAKGLLPPG